MHKGFTRRGLDWRAWIVVLVVGLIGATSAWTVWHEEHGPDQDCTVCQLRHQTVADLSGAPPVRSVDTSAPVSAIPFVARMASDLRSQTPVRAPPA